MESVEFTIEDTRNPQWVKCDLESIFSAEELQKLSDDVFSHKEASFTVDKTAPKAYDFPDFGASCLQPSALQHICEGLSGYLGRAVAPVSDIPAFTVMERRWVVWQRVVAACQQQVYSEVNLKRVVTAMSTEGWEGEGEEGVVKEKEGTSSLPNLPPEKRSGNDILVEMGVKTGLSVVFSLLKQAWAQLTWQRQIEQQLKAAGTSLPLASMAAPAVSLPNEVLRSVLEVLKGVPPLSLANTKAMSRLSIKCLEQSAEFLEWVVHPDSWVDEEGKRLTSEIVVSLALQRGSLNSMLEWAEKTLSCLASYEGSPEGVSRPSLSVEFCRQVLEEVRQRTVSEQLPNCVHAPEFHDM